MFHDLLLCLGSGKTTLLKDLVSRYPKRVILRSPDDIEWNSRKSIISHFSSDERGQDLLNSIGLNAVPTWIKPFPVLSQGEQYRATFARLLELALKTNVANFIAIDEFTSVLDRV